MNENLPDRDFFYPDDRLSGKIFPSGMILRTSKHFGTWIRHLRRLKGLTQVELAGIAGVGPRFIVDLESGKPTAALDKALHVAAMLGGRIDVALPQNETN